MANSQRLGATWMKNKIALCIFLTYCPVTVPVHPSETIESKKKFPFSIFIHRQSLTLIFLGTDLISFLFFKSLIYLYISQFCELTFISITFLYLSLAFLTFRLSLSRLVYLLFFCSSRNELSKHNNSFSVKPPRYLSFRCSFSFAN